LHLIVNTVVTGEETITICEGSLPYSWNGQSITSAGDYTATLVSSAGCDSIATLHLIVNNVVTGEETVTICEGSLPYSWNGQSITAAGNYTATLVSASGCDSIAILHLLVSPVVTNEETITLCQTDLPYNWNGQALTTAGTYTSTLVSITGCDSIARLVLIISPIPPAPVVAVTHATCAASTGSITVTSPAPGNGITYSIDGVNYQPENVFIDLRPGSYTISVRNASSCSASTTAAVIQIPNTMELSPAATNSICTANNGAIQLTVTNGTAPFTYSWTGPNQFASTDKDISNLAPGIYQVVATDFNGCKSSATITITQTEVLPTVATHPITLCSPANLTDPSVTAGSDAGLVFTYWMNEPATVPVPNPTAVFNGIYYIKGTNAWGCSVVKPMVVKIESTPKFIVTNPVPVCAPATVDLTASAITAGSDPGWTLSYWKDAAATIPLDNPSAVNASGSYYIKAAAVGGCSSVQVVQVTVTIKKSLASQRYPSITTPINVPVQLNARSIGVNDSYAWYPPTGLNDTAISNPVFRHNSNVEYTIRIDDGNNCPVIDTVLVMVRPANSGCVSDIFVPKAWSPNKDGHNDKLYPLPVCIRELKYFRVFNRWGQLVFETNQLGHGWDGMFKGVEQVMDVYTWTLEATGEDGRYFKRAGNSVLLR
jgi:gliding motility-associated-like protein